MFQTVENKVGLVLISYSIANCLKLTYISELVNLSYTFKTPFEISLKAMILGASSQFHDDSPYSHVNVCKAY